MFFVFVLSDIAGGAFDYLIFVVIAVVNCVCVNKMGSKTTVKELDNRVSDLQNHFEKELQKFRDEIEKVKTPEIPDGREENRRADLMHKFTFFEATIKNEMKKILSEVNKLKGEHTKLICSLDDTIQDQHKSKLVLHGLKEEQGENLYDEIINIINMQMKIQIQKTDLNICYRLGSKKYNHSGVNKCRPVLIDFLCVWKRNEVYYRKKVFKGSKLVLAEYLSPMRHELYKTAKRHFGRNCWTRNCKIGFNHNSSVQYVATLDQLLAIINHQASQSRAGTEDVAVGEES